LHASKRAPIGTISTELEYRVTKFVAVIVPSRRVTDDTTDSIEGKLGLDDLRPSLLSDCLLAKVSTIERHIESPTAPAQSQQQGAARNFSTSRAFKPLRPHDAIFLI
jgi:hypothetical protein